jgi:7,8-dihydroneopterin aldolase/epimerase/oxygenase
VGLTVELRGLEVFGHHGATAKEQEEGQTLLWDLAWELRPPERDELSETVDYDDVAALVRKVSGARRYQLLETLAAAVADAVQERFPVERVRVSVRKTGLGLPVEYSMATVQRP